jgi:hypothetical protein
MILYSARFRNRLIGKDVRDSLQILSIQTDKIPNLFGLKNDEDLSKEDQREKEEELTDRSKYLWFEVTPFEVRDADLNGQ